MSRCRMELRPGRKQRLKGAASETSRLITKELSPETWSDFEKLFGKHGGVQGGCWCVCYQRARPPPRPILTREERREANRRDKEVLSVKGAPMGSWSTLELNP